MKILVVGGIGMLGSDLVVELTNRGHEIFAPSLEELDITDPSSVAEVALDGRGIEWCVNCAAYTAVDKAETEREQAAEINTLGASFLARSCAMAGMKLIHISTDFVFDGEATEPYTEDAPTNPTSYYGLTKRDGEDAVRSAMPTAILVRTSWLYGPNGPSFPRTMIRAWEAGKTLKVVSDQTGNPTYTGDLARTLVNMMEKDIFPDTYHATGPESMTWHGFATETLTLWEARKTLPRPVEIEPIPTEAYPTPAKRPKYSVLSNAKLQANGIEPMRPVKDALTEFIERGAKIDGWL